MSDHLSGPGDYIQQSLKRSTSEKDAFESYHSLLEILPDFSKLNKFDTKLKSVIEYLSTCDARKMHVDMEIENKAPGGPDIKKIDAKKLLDDIQNKITRLVDTPPQASKGQTAFEDVRFIELDRLLDKVATSKLKSSLSLDL